MTRSGRMTGQERREQLLGVARGLFAEKGFEATTVEDIAERAGVTRPVVYEHFGGKQGIYAVVVDREVRRLTAAIAEPLRPDTRPRAAAEGAARAFLAYIDTDAEGFLILTRDAPVGGGRGSFASVLDAIAAQAEEILRSSFATRELPDAAAPMYARMLVGAVAMLGEWWLEERGHSREEVAAHAINLLWNGLVGLEAEPTLHGTTDEDR